MNRLIQYLRDTKGELRHVSWPTRKQAVLYTTFVIALSLATAVVLGAFDFLFTGIVELII